MARCDNSFKRLGAKFKVVTEMNFYQTWEIMCDKCDKMWLDAARCDKFLRRLGTKFKVVI